MNELSLFIEYLLLTNDFVSIPGIGTLVAQPYESAYDAEDEALLPPYRQVSFTTEEQKPSRSITDDIRKIYNLPQEEAERKLSVWTSAFFQTLTEDGGVDFGSVGSFSTDNGEMTFRPSLSGVTTPDYYALDVLQIKPISEATPAPDPIIKSDDKNFTIRISKNVVTYAAAACVALILFFASGVKVFDTESTLAIKKHLSALFLPSNLMPSLEDSAEMNAAPNTTDTQAQTTTQETAAPEATESEHDGRFCIVLASAISHKNAEAYVQTLKSEGFDSARILEGKMIRVAIGNYQTRAEAYSAVREIQQAGGDFQYAWVYENQTH